MPMHLNRRQTLLTVAALCLALAAAPARAQAPPEPPAPGGRITEEYARALARFAYVWAWPMVNVHNRKVAFERAPIPGLVGGVVPVAPPNHLCMLTDYVTPEQKMVVCPNQDVVYGFGVLDLGTEPVVLQVPDFGERFWVYQLGDQRTDGFAEVGKMYGTEPGLYLLVGPDWQGEAPAGIAGVFRCPTRLGYCVPRVFMDDTPAERAAILPLVNQIMAYPVVRYDGTAKSRDWSKAPRFPAAVAGNGEMKWVAPETFFAVLPQVLDEVPPLAGEQALYDQLRALLAAAESDAALAEALQEAAADADRQIVAPLFEFGSFGLPLPHHWSTISNGAAFGTDYFTRTAVAKSNIFVNRANETRYFYQDLDAQGERLSGQRRYTVTFSQGQLPPVRGFWSLTLYNDRHFFHPNKLGRYSLGTKNQSLAYDADGSLTLTVQAEPPGEDRRANWLPAPPGEFSLYLRAYWPEAAIARGRWTPPAVVREE